MDLTRLDLQVPGLVALSGAAALLLALLSHENVDGIGPLARILGLVGLVLVTGAILLFGGRITDGE